HALAIKALRDSETKLREAVENGDFPRAINICLKAQGSLPLFKHFVSIRGLSDTLEDSMVMVENRLDDALVNVCRDFDAERYEKIISAFRLLGKTYRVHDKMQRHFLRTIQSNCQNIVYAHVLQTDSRPELLKRMQFRELCQSLHSDNFLPCLSHLLEVNCDVMFIHWRIRRWHNDFEARCLAEGEGGLQKYAEIKNALVEIGKNMWEEAQRRIAILLNALNLSAFKIDPFLQVLDSVNKFIEIGEAFSGIPSRSLTATLNKQSKDHFTAMHVAMLNDMKVLLENEMWIPIPVAEDYALRNISEFQSFLEISPARLQRTRETHDLKRSPDVIFSEFEKHGNPCAIRSRAHASASRVADETGAPASVKVVSEEEAELDQESIQEADDEPVLGGASKPAKTKAVVSTEMIVSSTAINIAKTLGKYLHMMQVLQPILPLVLDGFMEIFKYYLYTIYSFFGGLPSQPNAAESFFPTLTPRLRRSLTTIKQELTPVDPQSHPASSASGSSSSSTSTPKTSLNADDRGLLHCLSKVATAKLSPSVDIKTRQTVFGVSQRSTGIESLIFLAAALRSLQEHLGHLIPKALLSHLGVFFKDYVGVAGDLQRYLYQILQRMLIHLEPVPSMITTNVWELEDASKTREYVQLVTQEFVLFSARLEDAVKRGLISPHISDNLWKLTVQFAMEQLVEGYSRLPVCSDGARALMHLDLVQITNEIKRLSSPALVSEVVPIFEHAGRYIKAYYYPQIELIPFASDNARSYTPKQLIALLAHSTSKLPKATQREMIKQVESILKLSPSTSGSTPTSNPATSSSKPPAVTLSQPTQPKPAPATGIATAPPAVTTTTPAPAPSAAQQHLAAASLPPSSAAPSHPPVTASAAPPPPPRTNSVPSAAPYKPPVAIAPAVPISRVPSATTSIGRAPPATAAPPASSPAKSLLESASESLTAFLNQKK
ncbi:MAG: syndetin, partial [archaeon]|nr:syndetin [archaeon]